MQRRSTIKRQRLTKLLLALPQERVQRQRGEQEEEEELWVS